DGPEGPAERYGRVDLQEVRPVDVTELGGHEAVDEPADEDDLGGVARADDVAAAAAPQQDDPAEAAQREAEVVDREPGQNEQRVRSPDDPRQQGEIEPGQGLDEQCQEEERQDERDDRPG